MVYPQQVSQIFRTRDGEVRALDDVSLRIEQGEFVVIRGPSGSGKTTLLLTLGGMLHPTCGQVIVNGCDIYAMSERQRAAFRAENIGFVFQLFHLVPYLTVLENVLLSGDVGANQARASEARDLLKRLHISERQHHKPSALSIGERQRTAVARALLSRPKLILADEPTGNLDPDNAAEVIEALVEFHQAGGTVIVVTHGGRADRHASSILHLQNGRLVNEKGTA